MRSVRVLLTCALAFAHSWAGGGTADGFVEWHAPWLRIDAGERRRLAEGRVLSRTLPSEDGQIGLFLAAKLDADADAFVRKVRNSEALWRTEKIPQVAAFSSPPRLEDLDALRLDTVDQDAIPRCRPGDCGLKLSGPEMTRLRAAAGKGDPASREAVQAEFRQVVLDRVRTYVSAGLQGVGPFHDHDRPTDPVTTFSRLLLRVPWMAERARALAEYLERYPAVPRPDLDSFLYWMRTTHPPKPTIQVTHVVIERRDEAGPGPAVVVASKQVFATHYVNGSLSISAFFPEPEGGGYLTYINRSHVDGIEGWLSGVRRFFVERRVRESAEKIFELQRQRIES